MKRRVGVLENLYSGTSKRFAITFPSTLTTSPFVTAKVTLKTSQKPALERFGSTPNCLFNATSRLGHLDNSADALSSSTTDGL